MFRLSFTFFFTIIIFCLVTDASMLNAQSPPSITLSSYDTVVCPNDSVLIEVQISGQPTIEITYSVEISGETKIYNASSKISNTIDIYLNQSGTYSIVSYSNWNTPTIDTNVTFNIQEVAPPTAQLLGGGQFCANESVLPIEVLFSGSAPWELTYQNNLGNAIIESFLFPRNELLSMEGRINIRAVRDLHCEIEVRDTLEIELFDIPIVDISGEEELCKLTGATYLTPYNSTYKYRWLVPKEATTNIDEDFQANILPLIWKTAGEFSIELIAEIKNTGCLSEKAILPIKIHDFPDVLNGFDTVLCFEQEPFLRINPSKIEENTIYWPHLGSNEKEIDISIPGSYAYLEKIPFGCEASGNFRVIDKCIPEIYVAEAFSPNNDGINDVLEVKGVFYNLFYSIYSSTGELVYVKSPDMGDWDGTSNNTKMPIGDYYWKANFTDKFGEPYSDEGWVSLIR